MRAHIKVVLALTLILSVVPARMVASAEAEGIFVVLCGFSHRLPDDPIVKPAMPGGSHNHDFFGNKSTNAFSTYTSLRSGTTSCTRMADKASYWVPTLYDRGVAVKPFGMSAYYTARGKKAENIVPFPEGLRVVAGNAKATSPQPMMVTAWTCNQNAATETSTNVPACPSNAPLFLHVRFPDCWDGKNLDFTDHRSHLAYSMWGYCPAGYPVMLPGLQINVAYPIYAQTTRSYSRYPRYSTTRSGITFSSGSAYTAHADFFNAWDQSELSRLVTECLNTATFCGTGG